MSSLSQPLFSRHDFACSNFNFLLKAKFVAVMTWTCWKLKFLLRPHFSVVTSIQLQADFFLFLLKFEFLLYFPVIWNLSQLSLFCKQFTIILIINSEKWIKNLVSFWTHHRAGECHHTMQDSSEVKRSRGQCQLVTLLSEHWRNLCGEGITRFRGQCQLVTLLRL